MANNSGPGKTRNLDFYLRQNTSSVTMGALILPNEIAIFPVNKMLEWVGV